jgi:tRNA threonylcarbamoyladenosine biosynthesis protein TsaE
LRFNKEKYICSNWLNINQQLCRIKPTLFLFGFCSAMEAIPLCLKSINNFHIYILMFHICTMDIEFTLDDINAIAKKLWQQYKQYPIWAFQGEMGSGKTTFIRAICEVLQVKDVISSPTFAIINEYRSPIAGIIYHMDWYRLEDEEEAVQAGIEDCLLSGNICLIEWPDKAVSLLRDDTLNIHIETVNKSRRRLCASVAAAKEIKE